MDTTHHKIYELKNQEQELHALRYSFKPYELANSIYNKVKEFEYKNLEHMKDFEFKINLSDIDNYCINVDVQIKHNIFVEEITSNFIIENPTVQNRIEKREIMKKKINKIRNANVLFR